MGVLSCRIDEDVIAIEIVAGIVDVMRTMIAMKIGAKRTHRLNV